MSLEAVPLRGPWPHKDVEEYLSQTAIPMRLSVTSPSGWPMVLSLWFDLEDGQLLCATQRTAAVVRALEADPRCAFEVAGETPPYRGVRGRGLVELDSEEAPRVLRRLIERYLGSTDGPLARWLLGRSESEVCIRIRPERLTSWDFSRRMAPTDSAG